MDLSNSEGLEATKPDLNAIQRQAEQGLPVCIPWHRKVVRLGTSFNSRVQGAESWVEETPFILSDLFTIPRVLRRDAGAEATFTSTTTSRLCETGDHLSLGFGAGVGPPGLYWLANVSVKGTYDKDVQENKDSDKTSIHAHLKTGSIELLRRPRLTTEAIKIIKYGGGYAAFCKRYGDYYVAGYRLGGETGFMISSSTFRNKKVEKLGLTVAAEVLFVEASTTHSEEFESFSSGRSLKLVGFDTLDGLNWNAASSEANGSQELQRQAKDIILRSQCLRERVGEILCSLQLPDEELYDSFLRKGQELSSKQCDALLNAGAVVELLLMPMDSIREVTFWKEEDDVI